MLESMLQGIGLLFNLENFLLMNVGVFIGIVFGAVPGLTGNLGIVLFLPMTFVLSPIAGISMLIGIYFGGSYGGSVSAILLGTPGSNAAVATVFDGYPMALQGRAKKALNMALVASVIGGLLSTLSLLIAGPLISKVAISFGPPEYFALAIFGLSIIAGVSGESLVKGVLSACLGIVVSMIGLDAMSGVTRFTFGSVNLLSGLNMLAVLLGVFAIPTVMIKILNRDFYSLSDGVKLEKGEEGLTSGEIKECMPTILQASLTGIGVGALPGAGAEVAAFISYNNTKNSSKDPSVFGTGVLKGVAAPEAANNGVTAASLIPLLTLGIPGSVNAAALIGALTMHDLIPGPMLFRNQGPVIYALIFGMIFVNLFILLQGKLLLKVFQKIIYAENILLIPLLVLFCFAGAYSATNTIFNVYVLLAFGIISYMMLKLSFPIAPLVLGMVLGPIAETNLRRSMVMSDNVVTLIFTRPICLFFIALSVLLIVVLRRQNKKNKDKLVLDELSD